MAEHGNTGGSHASKIEIDKPTGQATTGHEWDGIKELNTPLPRWWLWTFYACIAFSLVYALWPGNKQKFDRAARTPLDDEKDADDGR